MSSKLTPADHAKIADAFANSADAVDRQAAALVETAISELDQGKIKVVELHDGGDCTVNEWVKKAILVYFRLRKVGPISAGDLNFLDKIPVKRWRGDESVRVVPLAIARYGSFISPGAILMPSLVNIGAFVGAGTMVDTWATVGSCAYVGAGVHLSGGVGIGGVLEPVQARPVVIEDGAFIGSRAIIVEGVHVEAGAVIAAGVTLTQSTKIIDVSGTSPIHHRGRIPKNSVVIPGTIDKQFAAGTYGVSCALIIGKRKESTNLKTSLNDALREFDIAT